MPAPQAIATIKRGRKFDQVLEGARTVFLRDGYSGASVDDIATEAGVSKATLYSYFPDKQILFICASGNRSYQAADYFRSLGYDARSIAGGTAAWQLHRLPMQV